MKIVLLTGSSGFIGSYLIRELQRAGNYVVGTDIKPPREGFSPDSFQSVDVTDSEGLLKVFQEHLPDDVVHLAATHDLSDITLEQNGLASYAVNIEGSKNVLAACIQAGSVQRYILTSSQMVSEPGHKPTTLDECRPKTYYGQSKLETERYLHSQTSIPFSWTIVRPTTVWGPGMNPHYQRFLSYIKRGKYFHLSKKPLYKSYSYIENISYQYLKILSAEIETVNRKTFYLADYEPLSLRDYANGLQRYMHAKPIPYYNESFCKLAARVGDLISKCGLPRFPFTSFRVSNILNEYIYKLEDTEKVAGSLPVSFEEGVKRTAEWYLETFK